MQGIQTVYTRRRRPGPLLLEAGRGLLESYKPINPLCLWVIREILQNSVKARSAKKPGQSGSDVKISARARARRPAAYYMGESRVASRESQVDFYFFKIAGVGSRESGVGSRESIVNIAPQRIPLFVHIA